MRIAIVVLVAALAGACSTAPEPQGAQSATAKPAAAQAAKAQPAKAKQASAKSDRVCKKFTPTGSNMPQRVCHSKEEWAAIETRDRENSDALANEMRSATTSRP